MGFLTTLIMENLNKKQLDNNGTAIVSGFRISKHPFLLICFFLFFFSRETYAQAGYFWNYDNDNWGYACKDAMEIDYDNNNDGMLRGDDANNNPSFEARGGLIFGDKSSKEGIASNRRSSGGTGPTNGLNFITANTPRMVITNGGNVGIGTTAPATKLEIAGNFRVVESGVTAEIGVFDGNSNGNNKGTYLYTKQNNPLYFATNNNWAQMTLATTGNVGIGTTNPGSYKLAVEGTIGAREVEVKTGSWADFVFDNEYKLKSLKEVEHYIATHKHLPDVPSEATVKKDGINVAKMDAVLLQKIEELTLYLIEQNKQIDSLKKEIETIKSNRP